MTRQAQLWGRGGRGQVFPSLPPLGKEKVPVPSHCWKPTFDLRLRASRCPRGARWSPARGTLPAHITGSRCPSRRRPLQHEPGDHLAWPRGVRWASVCGSERSGPCRPAPSAGLAQLLPTAEAQGGTVTDLPVVAGHQAAFTRLGPHQRKPFLYNDGHSWFAVPSVWHLNTAQEAPAS